MPLERLVELDIPDDIDESARTVLQDAQFEIEFLRAEREVWVAWEVKQREKIERIEQMNGRLKRLISALAQTLTQIVLRVDRDQRDRVGWHQKIPDWIGSCARRLQWHFKINAITLVVHLVRWVTEMARVFCSLT